MFVSHNVVFADILVTHVQVVSSPRMSFSNKSIFRVLAFVSFRVASQADIGVLVGSFFLLTLDRFDV